MHHSVLMKHLMVIPEDKLLDQLLKSNPLTFCSTLKNQLFTNITAGTFTNPTATTEM